MESRHKKDPTQYAFITISLLRIRDREMKGGNMSRLEYFIVHTPKKRRRDTGDVGILFYKAINPMEGA